MENQPSYYSGPVPSTPEIKEHKRVWLAAIIANMDIPDAMKSSQMRHIGVDFVMYQETGIIVEVLPETATGQKP